MQNKLTFMIFGSS